MKDETVDIINEMIDTYIDSIKKVARIWKKTHDNNEVQAVSKPF